jgi:hypothetical protein
MALRTYDFNRVVVLFAGFPITGFGSNGGVSITFNEDVWDPVVGADGEESRARKNNDGAECTITLMQTSMSNDLLQGFLELDIATGYGVYPMLIKDLNGLSTYGSAAAYIKARPAASYNAGVEEREWTIRMLDVKDFCGGNLDTALLG